MPGPELLTMVSNPLVFELAHRVAGDLADRGTDPNEVAKLATTARVAKNGSAFFRLLTAVTGREGVALVRTGQTRRYYEEIREACERHLLQYRTATGEQAEELATILGWSVRLLRYYATPHGQAELAERQRAAVGDRGAAYAPVAQAGKPARPSLEPGSDGSAAPLRTAPPPPRPIPPREETKRETVTLVSRPKNGKAQVRTEAGEQVSCAGLPGFPPAEPETECRADVTRAGGKAVRAQFKGWS